jgi:protein-tyrosine phosphatase
MFRDVGLPEGVAGRLYLHSMPGRYEPFERVVEKVRELRVGRVIRLAPLDEVERKSPAYFAAIREGRLPWVDEGVDVKDYGVPQDQEAFLEKARSVADSLRNGERVLAHCGAGVGRTGMFAICVLMALGLPREEAEWRVREAGSGPETKEQRIFLGWVEGRLGVARRAETDEAQGEQCC